MPPLRRLWPFLLALLVLLGVAGARGGEYDEYYSVFLVAGDARPAWPAGVFTAGSVRAAYTGESSMGGVARDLRRGDVHPPLYFWALSLWRRLAGGSAQGSIQALLGWKRAGGDSLFRLRLLSVAFSLASLVLIASIAGMMAQGAMLPVLFTLLSYGFAYTGVIARDFALALLFLLLGVRLLLEAERRGHARFALLGGLALGAACFTNYLAAFTAAAGLIWLGVAARRRPRLWLAAGAGGAAFLPAMLWFFLAQRDSRAGQFAPFHLPHALALLARDQAGAIFGGLPDYLPPPASMLLAALLAVLLLALVMLICRDGLRRLAPSHGLLCLLGLAAPPLGLLALGAAFDNTPIELRYFAFGLPFFGLLLAAALRDRPALVMLALSIEAASVVGLAVAPATMQPAARLARTAAAWPGALVLLPFGNDGVGIPGPFIAASPDDSHIALVSDAGPEVLAEAAPFRRVLIPEIAVDRQSRMVLPALSALFAAAPCWKTDARSQDIDELKNTCRSRPPSN